MSQSTFSHEGRDHTDDARGRQEQGKKLQLAATRSFIAARVGQTAASCLTARFG